LHCIQDNENEIVQALYDDFKKPAFEAVITETNYVISELKETIRIYTNGQKPEKVFPSILNFLQLIISIKNLMERY
jgi:aldehyde dehydrogenase (NAD+)